MIMLRQMITCVYLAKRKLLKKFSAKIRLVFGVAEYKQIFHYFYEGEYSFRSRTKILCILN